MFQELALRIKDRHAPSISFCGVCSSRVEAGLGGIPGAIDAVEAGRAVGEECHAQEAACACGKAWYDESTGLPLDPKMVDDAVEEVVEFM